MAMPEALAGPWKISAGQPHAAYHSTLSETGKIANGTSASNSCRLMGTLLVGNGLSAHWAGLEAITRGTNGAG